MKVGDSSIRLGNNLVSFTVRPCSVLPYVACVYASISACVLTKCTKSSTAPQWTHLECVRVWYYFQEIDRVWLILKLSGGQLKNNSSCLRPAPETEVLESQTSLSRPPSLHPYKYTYVVSYSFLSQRNPATNVSLDNSPTFLRETNQESTRVHISLRLVAITITTKSKASSTSHYCPDGT